MKYTKEDLLSLVKSSKSIEAVQALDYLNQNADWRSIKNDFLANLVDAVVTNIPNHEQDAILNKVFDNAWAHGNAYHDQHF